MRPSAPKALQPEHAYSQMYMLPTLNAAERCGYACGRPNMHAADHPSGRTQMRQGIDVACALTGMRPAACIWPFMHAADRAADRACGRTCTPPRVHAAEHKYNPCMHAAERARGSSYVWQSVRAAANLYRPNRKQIIAPDRVLMRTRQNGRSRLTSSSIRASQTMRQPMHQHTRVPQLDMSGHVVEVGAVRWRSRAVRWR